MAYELVFPESRHKEAWRDIINEFISYGEKPPSGLHLKTGQENFDDYLRRTQDFHNGVNIPAGLVPMSTYFLMEKNGISWPLARENGPAGQDPPVRAKGADIQSPDNTGPVLGAITIRHYLNEYLLNVNGNIGYVIRPSRRGEGLATVQLNLALKLCKERGMGRVLVTCNDDNYASAAVILKNGGVFENRFKEDNGNTVLRYWVDLF